MKVTCEVGELEDGDAGDWFDQLIVGDEGLAGGMECGGEVDGIRGGGVCAGYAEFGGGDEDGAGDGDDLQVGVSNEH